MDKYRLRLVNDNGSGIYVPIWNSKSGKKEVGVNLYDIDQLTTSIASKNELLREYTTNDFIPSNAYIEKGDYKYGVIYGNHMIEECTKNIYSNKDLGIIISSDCSPFLEYRDKFLEELGTKEVEDFLEYYHYNQALKMLLVQYNQLKIKEKKELISSEEINVILELSDKIRKELRRYKTFRGLVLAKIKYSSDRFWKLKPNNIASKSTNNVKPNLKRAIGEYKVIRECLVNDKLPDHIRFMMEHDEILDEEEYSSAYENYDENSDTSEYHR